MSDVAPAGIMMMGVRDSGKKQIQLRNWKHALSTTAWARTIHCGWSLQYDFYVLKFERKRYPVDPPLFYIVVRATFKSKSWKSLQPSFSLIKKTAPTPQLSYVLRPWSQKPGRNASLSLKCQPSSPALTSEGPRQEDGWHLILCEPSPNQLYQPGNRLEELNTYGNNVSFKSFTILFYQKFTVLVLTLQTSGSIYSYLF